MSKYLSSTLMRAAIVTACVIASASCGGDMLRTGRSAAYLVVQSISTTANGSSGTATSFLLSDVQVLVDVTTNGVTVKVPTVFNDNVIMSIRADAKNPAVVTTAVNAITLTRYHVEFRRTDGQKRPGVDVPFGFDGGLSATIAADGNAQNVGFELVRHQSKLEPPLINMVGFGGLGFLSAIADITIYGHDQNGNEVQATGSVDVHFADFGDS